MQPSPGQTACKGLEVARSRVLLNVGVSSARLHLEGVHELGQLGPHALCPSGVQGCSLGFTATRVDKGLGDARLHLEGVHVLGELALHALLLWRIKVQARMFRGQGFRAKILKVSTGRGRAPAS